MERKSVSFQLKTNLLAGALYFDTVVNIIRLQGSLSKGNDTKKNTY